MSTKMWTLESYPQAKKIPMSTVPWTLGLKMTLFYPHQPNVHDIVDIACG
jgi:hypothetical protein